MVIVFGSSADEVDDHAYRISRTGEKVEGVCTPSGLAIMLEKFAGLPIKVLLIDGKGEHWLEYRAAPSRVSADQVGDIAA